MTRQTMYVGLGSNVGDREAHLFTAINRLREDVSLCRVSSLYESAPVGPVQDQPDFINAVGELETELAPREVLRRCLAIEAAMGRERQLDKGPRVIDLDLLLAGGRVESWPELDIPHPELVHRAFVLRPLLELCPDLRDPRDGRPLAEHLAALGDQTLSTYQPLAQR
ncbi:MAG: 2-amino-4-hydroxy-6-hydroxymethyldihydropteridine diphosphokinase [Deltaproteobacteria bacterium]|nr:2-amino-4-hydroxy-6-hydroxymethyldihydropteridine diphosphokinase [Deltaproteobacteria bacterium]